MSAPLPPSRFIDMTPTWAEAAQIIAAALENGTPTGQEAARKELFRMAGLLDRLNAQAHVTPEPNGTALQAETALASLTGPQAVEHCLNAGLWTQAQLAAASGLAPNTLTAFKKGKRPNAAQRAALCWALAKRCP